MPNGIKNRKGLIINERQEFCKRLSHRLRARFGRRPRSAIASGCIDFVLSQEEIARIAQAETRPGQSAMA
jgi:hypothetical protein